MVYISLSIGLVSNVTFTAGGTNRLATTKTYDALNRLTEIRSVTPVSSVVGSHAYQYNAANQRTQRTEADGSYWQYGYDSLGQVTNAVRRWSDTIPVVGQQYGYQFDDIGNRQRSEVSGQRSDYSGNLLNQYESRSVPGFVNVTGLASNAATVSVGTIRASRQGDYFHAAVPLSNTTSAVYTSLVTMGVLKNAGSNQTDVVATKTGTVFVAQSPEPFTHDADGNVISDGRWTYTWDAENRLVGAESLTNAPAASRRKIEWTYDGQGRRIRQRVYAWNTDLWTLTSDLLFAYDGWQCLAELNATNNAAVRSYTWGLDLSGTQQDAGGVGGLLFGTFTGSSSTSTVTYAFDGNGNVAALVEMAAAQVVAVYECGPFGEAIRASGPLAKENPFRFSTKRTDETTGLVLYEYRVYAPVTGRWLSPDPLGETGGLNLYGFVSNDPLGWIDPFGLSQASLIAVQTRDHGHQVLLLETAGESSGAIERPAYSVLLERRADNAEWTVIGYNADANALAPLRAVLESTGRTIYLGSVGESGALTIYHQGRALTTTDYAWLYAGAIAPVWTFRTGLCLASISLAQDPTSGRNWAVVGAMVVLRPTKPSTPHGQVLYRGVPGNGTPRAVLAEQGVAVPRGTALDQPSLLKHVLAEDVSAGVTSWTFDRAVAARFAGPNGTIIEVPLAQVSNRIVPRPPVPKYMDEREVLLKGTIQGVPTRP